MVNMSELKVYRDPKDGLAYREFYEKSEVDKVIAELEESHKNKVKQLLILNREQANAANRLRNSMEQVIFHQKYKRCLAMAKWCHNQREIYERDSYDWELDRDAVVSLLNKANIMRRWRKRWLALAEEPTWAKFLQLIHKEEK